MCVALAALDATVHLMGAAGTRSVPLTDLHRLPGNTPEVETSLEPGELITAVEGAGAAVRQPLDLSQGPRPGQLRLRAGVGGRSGGTVGRRDHPGPARARRRRGQALARLRGRTVVGRPATEENLQRAAAAAVEGASPLRHNGFKIDLAERLIVSTLQHLAAQEARP